MVTTNITFLLARKFDVGKMNQEGRNQQTIQGTNSDFWNCEEERTVWKPGLGKEKIKRGPDKQKLRHNKSWETGGWRVEAYNILGQTGQAKLARSYKKSHSKVTVNFKSSKKEDQRVKPAEGALDRAQSKIAMPESEGEGGLSK